MADRAHGYGAAVDLDAAAVTLAELRKRRSYKWRRFPDDVLPAFVAEMDLPLAEPVVQAINEAVAAGDCGYAWHDADLAEALAGFQRTRFDWNLDPSAVRLIPDVMAGVTELLRVAVTPGDGVVINTPVYPPFFSHIREAGCRVVEVPLTRTPTGYDLNLERLDEAFAAGARAYLLCNPHNPTGRVFSRSELEEVAALAERHGVLILADEIHAPLVLAGATHTPFLSVGGAATARGIALVSASKGWNIPGLKCAQAVTSSASMAALIARLSEDFVFRSGNLGIIASIAAYRDGGVWLDQVLALVDSNRRLLAEELAEHLPEVGYRQPEGGYLAWLDCSALGLDAEPAEVFLERGRVALAPGLDFGPPGRGHARITMATTAAILIEIVRRLSVARA
jgi:cysteine-S-conjugate beta-lyase